MAHCWLRPTATLAGLCHDLGIGFSIENPRTSMIWSFPPFVQLAQREGVFIVDLVYCSYGAPWMKPTRLMTNVRALVELGCCCTGDHEHITL